MERLREQKDPTPIFYEHNPSAPRPDTYNQVGTSVKAAPYLVISKTKRPDIARYSPLTAECFQGKERTFFAGLMPTKLSGVYVSDFQGHLLAFEEYSNGYLMLIWNNYLPKTTRARIAYVRYYMTKLRNKKPLTTTREGLTITSHE